MSRFCPPSLCGPFDGSNELIRSTITITKHHFRSSFLSRPSHHITSHHTPPCPPCPLSLYKNAVHRLQSLSSPSSSSSKHLDTLRRHTSVERKLDLRHTLCFIQSAHTRPRRHTPITIDERKGTCSPVEPLDHHFTQTNPPR